MKFGGNNFYILTLQRHLSERGVDLSVDDLFDIKQSYQHDKGSKDSLSLEHRQTYKILFSLLEWTTDPDLELDPDLIRGHEDRLLRLLYGLILFPLSKLKEFNLRHANMTRDERIAKEKFFVLSQQFKLSGQSL